MSNFSEARNLADLTQHIQTLLSQEAPFSRQMRSSLWQDLLSPSLVNKIRNIIMNEVGLGQFGNYLDQIDDVISRAGLGLPAELSSPAIGNLAVLSPTSFQRSLPYYSQAFGTMDYPTSSLIFARRPTFEAVIDFLSDKPDLRVSPTFAIVASFAAAAHDPAAERSIIQSLLHKVDRNMPGANVGITCMNRRLERLGATQAKNTSSKGKAALIIAGQMRALQQSLPTWKRQYNLKEFDVYVSTWDDIGYTPIDRARIKRRLHHSLIEEAYQLYSEKDLQALNDEDLNRSRKTANSLEKSIREALSEAKSVKINISEASHPAYATMNNSDKMYFHNAFWIRQLGAEYFLTNYDVIVKTRPDLLLKPGKPFSVREAGEMNGVLLNDHPSWLFEVWGFGCGDQMFAGPAELMVNVLDIQYPKSLSTRLLSETFHRGSMTAGHINIGIELWLSGGEPCSIGVQKAGLAKDELYTLETWNRLAEKASVAKLKGLK